MSNIFKKKMGQGPEQNLPIDPIQLYQTCNYKEGYAYLRGIQEEVLKAWHKSRTQRDVLCKMNTGSGKTLTGLLMLYSKLIELKLPCVYVCPDNQLVGQTLELAQEKYGIPVCEFSESESGFPPDFLNARKILVCNFHKLFNGKSIFTRDNIKIGAIILDDAHKCVDIAREKSSITVSRDHPIAEDLFRLFETALQYQLVGSFQRLKDGDPQMIMKVPHWTWFDNHKKIVQIINKRITEAQDEETRKLELSWKFMIDDLLTYDCYISGTRIEISPIQVPYHLVPSFNEAEHRYILSATFEDDYDLIKDLGISKNSLLSPIVPTDRRDVGRRLILAPSRFDPTLCEDALREFVAKFSKKLNVVVLVPSEHAAKVWQKLGAEFINTSNIAAAIEKLEQKQGQMLVLMNRYDGIDLHGDICRVLVIDGMPMYKALHEQYSETRLQSLNIGRKAQIIEQGLGRAVRSGADYCVTFVMGKELLGFFAYTKNLDYFTPVTRAQLNLGLSLLNEEEPGKNSLKQIKNVADLCLSEDPDWRAYHTQALSAVSPDTLSAAKTARIELADIEREALTEFRKRNYVKSGQIIQKRILDNSKLNAKEKAWYFQMAAQLTREGDRKIATELQTQAWNHSMGMHHPESGHLYNKLASKDSQPSMVKKALSAFDLPTDIKLYVADMVNALQYGPDFDSKLFERKLDQLGKFLGFDSQMPEDSTGDGPDGLWLLSDGHFLILEAKSRKKTGDIAKSDIEQLQQAEIWLKKRYGQVGYTAVTLQSSGKRGNNVHLEEQHQVISADSLELLRDNLSKYADALQGTHPTAHSMEDIQKLLVEYSLTASLFRTKYIKAIRG